MMILSSQVRCYKAPSKIRLPYIQNVSTYDRYINIYIYIIIHLGVTKLQMEIENIAIFDGYVLDTFSCDLFHRVNCQAWKTTRFLKEKHPTKNRKSFRYSPNQKTNKQKHLQQKTCEACFMVTLLGMCWYPAEKPFFQRGTTRSYVLLHPNNPSGCFWLDLRQFDLEEMGWLLNYLTSVGANAQKGWQEGVNVLIRLSAWKASQNLFLHTPFEFTHPDSAGSGLFCHW